MVPLAAIESMKSWLSLKKCLADLDRADRDPSLVPVERTEHHLIVAIRAT